jgi:hypothetical protein
VPHLALSLRELVESPWIRVTAGLLVAVSLVGGGLFVLLRDSSADANGCEVRSPVRISVAPDIAPVVADIARRVSSRESGCVSVLVTEAAPERVLADVSAGGRAPDVWIPDSTLWLTRAKQDKVLAALDAPAIATSPLVLALPKATATRLQPTGRPTVERPRDRLGRRHPAGAPGRGAVGPRAGRHHPGPAGGDRAPPRRPRRLRRTAAWGRAGAQARRHEQRRPQRQPRPRLLARRRLRPGRHHDRAGRLVGQRRLGDAHGRRGLPGRRHLRLPVCRADHHRAHPHRRRRAPRRAAAAQLPIAHPHRRIP